MGTAFKDDEKSLAAAMAAAEKADSLTAGSSAHTSKPEHPLFDVQEDTQAEAEKLALGK